MSYLKSINIADQSSGDTAEVNSDGEILVNAETLNLLVGTLQELVSRLDALAGMVNSGQPALRTIPIASVSTAVTGSLTSAGTVSTVSTVTAVTAVGSITNLGTGIPASESANAINRLAATQANINNVAIS